MIPLLIAGIVGMVAMFIVGWYAGRYHERETAMMAAKEAARIAVNRYADNILTRLQEIGQ